MRSTFRLSVLASAVAVSLAAGPVGVQAQQAAKPPAAAPAQPVLTPSHLAAARAVVISSGLARSFDTIVPELMGQLFANVTQTRPELTDDLKTVLSQLQPEFQKQTSQVLDLAAQAVASQVDEDSLKQINGFFTSPAGQKYVNAEPAMLTQMMNSIHGFTQQMSVQMMTRVRQEMQKRGKQL